MAASPLKIALEDLLKSRHLSPETALSPGTLRPLGRLSLGSSTIDGLLGGGFPRGHVSEIHGPCSSGRTGLALGLAACATRSGVWVAWLDPTDSFDPSSAAAAGSDLTRLLWLRGDPTKIKRSLSAAGVVLESGLFEIVILDVSSVEAAEWRRVPGTTWLRLERLIEGTPAALVIVASGHVFSGPGGVSLALSPCGARWSGPPGPGRLLQGLGAEAAAWSPTQRRAAFELSACC
jgi:recombination protein RecA